MNEYVRVPVDPAPACPTMENKEYPMAVESGIVVEASVHIGLPGQVSEIKSALKVSKLGCKDQESIQPSTTPDPGYQWERDKLTLS